MQHVRHSQFALTATWAALLLAYWPSGCAPPSTARNAQDSSPASAAQATLTAHPAFAHARAAAASDASIADIAERVMPSVVSIASRKLVQERDNDFLRFFGPRRQGPRERLRQGLGSGVIYSADGVIITNNHVVEGADEITVTTADGRDFDAKLVGADSESDVAVLKLEAAEGLVPIRFGDSGAMRVGDIVLAVGNPFGVGQTVTMGIVSAKGRDDIGIVGYADFIQTDAAINPGNSGGALVNMSGQLVGINTAIISRTGGNQGVGLAIPASMAEPIANALLTQGRVVRGFLGVGIQDLDGSLAAAMNLQVSQGVLITSVQPNSAAAKAGLARGDVVVGFGGQPVKSSSRLRNSIASAGANKQITLELLRGGKRKSVKLVLDEKPSETTAQPPKRAQTLGGLAVRPLDGGLRRRLGFDESAQGVVVTEVKPGSPADRSGLSQGDLIVEAGKQPVRDMEQLAARYEKAKGSGLLLLVRRGGASRYVVLAK